MIKPSIKLHLVESQKSEKLAITLTAPPLTTALGALINHITKGAESSTFQPMNINFGLFDSGGEFSRWILVVLSFVISFGLLWWIRKSKNAVRQISVALIIGGALGNALDRIIFGAVADFLNMSCCGVQNPFSFNLADVAIFLGAFILIVWDKTERDVA